ncbi:hypothetical protein B4N89_20530 [Embleya scabrispora]|uniref:Phage tail tape measure protein domain-containing protein n=1 Tax=Embleya scabrispora TaxID=159449 RepID=A0A1T3P228_9ACTN|nr:phage tail tape measure protein [Embleya scabrispora]OPC83002.1 hypothetical protein B4N89_20530 [Embleya scabrispora]
MALTVGELVAYLTIDDRGMQQGMARAEQTMQQAGRQITQTTERAGQQAGQNLAQGVGSGAQDAARLAQQGLGGIAQHAQQAGQQAGQQLDASLGSAAAQAGQTAATQAGQGLAGITGGARAAGTQAGAALDHTLGAIAQHAGQSAGQDASQALTHQMAQGGQDAGEAGGESLTEGLDAGTKAVAASGALLGAAFIAAFAEVMEREQITDRLNAQLGATGADAKQYGDLAGRLWKNAVVETVQEGADVIKGIVQQGLMPPDATNAQLESIATKVADVSGLLEEDFGRTSMAVSSMLKNGLVKTAEEALDVLTVGMQQGVNKGEDLLDTFAEYSPFLRQLGLDAQTSLGILKQGLEGGAWNSDILADSLKEGLLIMQGMAPPAAAAIKQLGLNADQMQAAFTQGGPPARAALQQVLDALRGIEDPTLRNSTALALFGTKLEDTQAALFALDPKTATKGMSDLAGAAERAGETMRDSAAVNMEKFKRSVQAGLVDFIGGEVLPRLLELASFAKNMWEGIPEGGKDVIQVLGLATLVVGGLTLAFSVGRAAVGAYQAMLAALSAQATVASTAMRVLQVSMGVLGLAAVAVTTVMALLGHSSKQSSDDVNRFTDSIRKAGGAVDESTKAMVRGELSQKGVLQSAQKLGLSMQDVTDAATGNAAAWERVKAAIGDRLWGDTAKDAWTVLGSLESTNEALKYGTSEWERQAEAQGQSVEQAREVAAQQQAVTRAAEDQEKAVKALKDSWDALNGKALDSMAAQDDLEASVDDLTASIEENGRTLDAGTEKGRNNRGAIRDMVEASYALSEATLQETGSREQANAVLATQRERLRATLEQMGYTKDQIAVLIQQYFRIPGEVGTSIEADPSGALRGVSSALGALARIPNEKVILISAAIGAGAAAALAMARQADGGILSFVNGGITPGRYRSYAGGGIEQHVAQIADGTPVGRYWAEEETDKESYIPWALAKRARSTAILARTASAFGFELMPASRTVGAPALAGIGTTAASATAGVSGESAGGRSVTVHIDNYYADGQSEQGIAEALWWEATKRGA